MNYEHELDRVFSIYIRMSYADHQEYVTCYTCELRLPWKQAQNGHFIRRGHGATRVHEDNCRPQCPHCNMDRNGMPESFEEHLRDDLGGKKVDELIELGKTERSFTDQEYQHHIRIYKDKIRAMGGII